LIIIPFTGTVDKAGHLEACTVCLPVLPHAPRREAAAEPGAPREAAVPDAEEAVAAPEVAAEAARGAQRVAAELDAQPVVESEPGAQPVAAAVRGEQPRAAAVAAQLQVVARQPALQSSSESAALRVPTMVLKAAKILCRRLGLAVLSV
jgi:hypothetical protein